MDKIDVSQADRLLVADMLDEVSTLIDHNGIGQVADLIRDGEYDEHDCVKIAARHRLATRTDATPVAESSAMPGSNGGFTMATFKASDVPVGTPLYTHPPATNVAALVEAAKEAGDWMEQLRACGDAGNWNWSDGDEYSNLIAALAPFTKGREAVRLLNAHMTNGPYSWPEDSDLEAVITVAKLLMNPPAPLPDPDGEAARRVIAAGYAGGPTAAARQMRKEFTARKEAWEAGR